MAEEQLIVMLQGMGNNERGWAQLLSRWGRVVLVQQGFLQHVEIWEQSRCLFAGPEISVRSTRAWDEASLSSLTNCRGLARVLEHTRGRKIDLIIACNFSPGFAALLMRLMGKARKVVVVLTDYLPPRGSWLVRCHRRITGILNTWAARWADEVWTVSPRIPTARVNPRNFVVPLCLTDHQLPFAPRYEIGYIGVPSHDHALDVLFDICRKHRLRLNVIGDSPFLQSIRRDAPPDAVFHGLLNDQHRINQILQRCFCGYAVYRNTGPDSYSYYGIPSKTLAFFASNTPIVTTNTAHFTAEIERWGVGRVVEPDPAQIESAVLELRDRFAEYHGAILRFRTEWNAQVLNFHRHRLSALGLDFPVSSGNMPPENRPPT